jgi:hypothetical protein
VLAEFEIDEAAFAGWSADELAKMNAHLTPPGASTEVDLEKLASDQPAHKCPQCGCEFD